jgi:hypothetical protein
LFYFKIMVKSQQKGASILMEFLAQMSLRLYAVQNDDLSEAAKKVFEKEVTNFAWALREDGAMINERLPQKKGRISFVIDTEDELTVRSFNLLPRYFTKQLTAKEIASLKLRVVIYSEGAADYGFWDEEMNQDAIKFTAEIGYIESVANLWIVICDSLK